MMKKLMMIVLCVFMLGCTPKEQYKLDYVTDGSISQFTEITDKEPSIKEISLPSSITFFENKYSGVMVLSLIHIYWRILTGLTLWRRYPELSRDKRIPRYGKSA